MLSNMKNRIFKSKIDTLIKRIPSLGKLLTTLFGAQEVFMLEFLRILESKLKINSISILNKYLFKGRWGEKLYR